MKLKSWKLSLFFLLLASNISYSDQALSSDNENSKRLPFESVLIEIRHFLPAPGSERIVVNKFGAQRVRTKESSKLNGSIPATKTWSMQGEGGFYTVDLITKTGQHFKTDTTGLAYSASKRKLAAEKMKALLKRTQIGTSIAAGVECVVWEISLLNSTKTRICEWNGFNLRVESIEGTDALLLSEASRIEVNAQIAVSEFDIPTGVTIIETDLIKEFTDLRDKMKKSAEALKELSTKWEASEEQRTKERQETGESLETSMQELHNSMRRLNNPTPLETELPGYVSRTLGPPSDPGLNQWIAESSRISSPIDYKCKKCQTCVTD